MKQAACDFPEVNKFFTAAIKTNSLFEDAAHLVFFLEKKKKINKYEVFGFENHVKCQSTVNMMKELISDSCLLAFSSGRKQK